MYEKFTNKSDTMVKKKKKKKHYMVKGQVIFHKKLVP